MLASCSRPRGGWRVPSHTTRERSHLSGIVQRQGKARLAQPASESGQRPLFFRAHLAEKRQRQMKIIRRDGPAGIFGEVRCPPLDNLLLDGRRQFKRKKQPFRLRHDRDSVMN